MRRQKVFGLDISDTSVEAVLLRRSMFGKVQLISYGRKVLRAELVKNGAIKKPEVLAATIKEVLASAQPKPIRTPYCILSLPESQVFTAVFKLPAGLRRDEIRRTIPFKAEEVIPFKSGEIYYDFKTISVAGSSQEVFYVAVPTAVVDGYVAVLQAAGLRPLAFDLESVSLARAVLGGRKPSKTATLLMDIGSRTTNLAVFDRNGIRQTRTIPIAGNRFTKAIATQLKVTPKKATELKVRVGFDTTKEGGRIGLVLQKELRRIIQSTKELMEFCQIENGHPITRIELVGGSSLLPKIDQYLADNLAVEVVIGNPMERLTPRKGSVELKRNAVLFANGIGLALRGTTRQPARGDINLLPAEKRFTVAPSKQDRHAWRFVYIRLAALVVLIALFGSLVVSRQRGFDPYAQLFPPPAYDTEFVTDLDLAVLDELRQQLNASSTESLATTTPTSTPTSTPAVVVPPEVKIRIQSVPGNSLNVRQGPGTSNTKVGAVESGKEFVVLEQQGDWYKILFDGQSEGWVFGGYVDVLE